MKKIDTLHLTGQNSINLFYNLFMPTKEAIEQHERINKRILDIKKLYQASIDGGDAEIFHKKCDSIPNTLVLIESNDNRKWENLKKWPRIAQKFCKGGPLKNVNFCSR